MQITELKIQNIKRIRAFHCGFDKDGALLTGNNAQGKSSILDAVMLALTNKGLDDPIRHGASKAMIKLNIGGVEGDYIVERKLTSKNTRGTLTVTAADGSEIKSPQAFLDGLVGHLAFDPLEFSRMGSTPKGRKEQASIIRELSGLDTSALDAKHKTIFDARTDLSRSVKAAEAVLQQLVKPEVPAPVTDEEQSASELIAKREKMNELLSNEAQARRELDTAHQSLFTAKREIDDLEAKLVAARSLHNKIVGEVNIAKDAHTAAEKLCPTLDESEALAKELSNLDANNAVIRHKRAAYDQAVYMARSYDEKAAALKTLEAQVELKTNDLEDIEEKKREMTVAARMPVEGMTVDDDGVSIKGIRFDQLSTAEQVRTSCAVAMQSNPKLKIILIREGALLNKECLAALDELAKDSGYQLWIEKFQEEPGAVGLHIEDGEVTHIDGQLQKRSGDDDMSKVPAAELELEGAAE